MEEIRLQKYLAECGIASRRKCEEFIEDGRVTINGRIAELGNKINPESDKIELDGKLVKQDKRSVTVNGQNCELTYKEFELLKMLLLNRGIVLTRDKIMDQVWGFEYEGESRTVDMHIKTLRQKLGTAGGAIKTVRNVGYMIDSL